MELYNIKYAAIFNSFTIAKPYTKIDKNTETEIQHLLLFCIWEILVLTLKTQNLLYAYKHATF